jgi:hypothetical protein
MGKFPLRPRNFSGVFTACTMMGLLSCPLLIARSNHRSTHQEKLSLPVIVVHQDQVSDIPVHVTVVPGDEHQMPVHVLVTADRYKPSTIVG